MFLVADVIDYNQLKIGQSRNESIICSAQTFLEKHLEQYVDL